MLALDMAIRMVDLTTLEGADTPGKARATCAKALRPDPGDPAVPPVAAVCVYPDLVGVCRAELAGSGVAVASVATAFPSGRASLAVKLADVADAVAAGADEVDMVIDRGAFLAGRYGQVFEEVQRSGSVRERPPQGDPGDRRARHAGQRVPRILAGDARGCRLHQDLNRQGHARRHAPGHSGDARGGARLRAGDRPTGRGEGGRRAAHRQGGHPLPGAGPRDRRAGLADARTVPHRRVRASSTTCSCSAASSSPVPTPGPDYFTVD